MKKAGRVTFIVGLPGSGKSCLSEQLAKETGAKLFDDLVPTEFDLKKMSDAISSGKSCVVNHPCLRKQEHRVQYANKAKQAGADNIQWIYFGNDPLACCINNTRRQASGDTRVNPDWVIHKMSAEYTIPEGVDTIEVWSQTDAPLKDS